ncbi:Sugar phosphate isomerase/epimerase [Paenibacillus sp. 1_12]|uniref:sugar phosphate isomerase/epimerase family protein n=1 Tax=Paenibacillus sp. 1_12 TaxID=1566278 RepID=UPI0008F1E949|nr:sugar phosphate isomerase/epimerase [Paenibacillus sp. 1_12]SFK99147.1 Sugar phosphate isomerase/epimerase [Paenibacillus sp. 1_12]
MKIAFQTLASPNWSWEETLNAASQLGYDGIELRGVEGEMYLSRARPFLPEHIEQTQLDLKQKGLEICCLDTSCSFHNEEKYRAAIQEGKDCIDLAIKLQSPYIRVFGDIIPEASSEAEIIQQISAGLTELGRHAEGTGVTVLLETHGDINNHRIIKEIMERTDSSSVGVLWDFEHPYLHGEEPEITYSELAPFIKHTHVKDAIKSVDGKKLCLIGDGDVPVPRIVSILKENGYDGWLSLEYEKKWAPYLEEPEVSLPAYISYIKKLV